MSRRERSQQVENVHLAGQTRDHLRRARRSFEVEHRAAGSERIACGAPVALADSIGANLGSGLARGCSQFFGARVVRVDHGNARRRIDRAVKEQPLGGEVLFHRLVIVEVVASEIGEDGDIEVDSGGAALVERVAGDFGDQLGGSACHALGHQLKQVARFGRGVHAKGALRPRRDTRWCRPERSCVRRHSAAPRSETPWSFCRWCR